MHNLSHLPTLIHFIFPTVLFFCAACSGVPVAFDSAPNAHGGQPYADGRIDHGVTQAPYERRFSPYDFNGGTTLAISGPDYAVIAADTRLSSGYEILSRDVTKLHALTGKCVLGSAGCKTDIDQLRSVLDIKMKVRTLTLCFCCLVTFRRDPACRVGFGFDLGGDKQ